ncbi:hypothetical protein MMG00_08085 [Ignatzschineria rhizosphaerae]|uniref:Lipoprotein n=1 Tax=Ignatzschineria rhizosphaerae TaxID=2923279 RepID=A0ABY3WX56_9GAMM|nr:hypothetical protein [Ignatzschineria rhizosphaerae]UNM95188.1 hypothetical protein MMG00_08085 [Ignatzschineria rhizosphaerae]
MFNKKLILSGILSAALLSGCATVEDAVNVLLSPGKKDTSPEAIKKQAAKIEIDQAGSYKINTYMRHAMGNNFSVNDYTKVWGNPTILVKNNSDYLLKWAPYDNNCTIYINFDPATKIAKTMDYHLSENCASINMTGPAIDVPRNEVFSPGYMAMRDRTLSDAMEEWIGKNVDKVLISWGSPYSAVPLNAGGKVYSWRNAWQTRPNVWSGEYTYGTCQQTFITDSKGTITSWDYSACNPENTYGKTPAAVPIPSPRG